LASEVLGTCSVDADAEGLTDVRADLKITSEEITAEDLVAVEVGGLSDAVELSLELRDLSLE
jgi:hypothetical protein